ncbi:hypothetical protein JTE90_023746 [Oedothorax gibbosus]|uniref:Receptor ligand binding region domain-containing protein n=1 Tax=Oedothorax gibbosus TaxID=931172 RepID=A0AAV6U885_9ARAC|nr:hypothetical protein JTE90_023746 [Oedothorax gibbosus]
MMLSCVPTAVFAVAIIIITKTAFCYHSCSQGPFTIPLDNTTTSLDNTTTSLDNTTTSLDNTTTSLDNTTTSLDNTTTTQTLNVVLLLPFNETYLAACDRVLPSVYMAFRDMKRLGVIRADVEVRVTPLDTQCDQTEGIYAALKLIETPDLFLAYLVSCDRVLPSMYMTFRDMKRLGVISADVEVRVTTLDTKCDQTTGIWVALKLTEGPDLFLVNQSQDLSTRIYYFELSDTGRTI